MFCYCFFVILQALFSSATSGGSSTLKAKISIFPGKTKRVCVLLFKLFSVSVKDLSPPSHSSAVSKTETPFFLLWERVCINQLNHPRSEIVHMSVYSVFGLFFPFEFLRMGHEYSTSVRILLSALQNVKLKAIGGTQPFSFSNIEHH